MNPFPERGVHKPAMIGTAAADTCMIYPLLALGWRTLGGKTNIMVRRVTQLGWEGSESHSRMFVGKEGAPGPPTPAS